MPPRSPTDAGAAGVPFRQSLAQPLMPRPMIRSNFRRHFRRDSELAERYPSSTRWTRSELWEWLCVEWLVAHWDSRPDPLDDVGRLTADFGYPAWFDLDGALCGFTPMDDLRARALGELTAARDRLRRRCRA